MSLGNQSLINHHPLKPKREYGKDPELFPVEVFWDADFTVPAAQPIRTRNGYPVRNGSPTKVYLKTAEHSIAIKNRNSAFILVDFFNKGWDASFVVYNNKNLKDTLDGQAITNEIQFNKNSLTVDILEFIPKAEWQAIFDKTSNYDCGLALDQAIATGKQVVINSRGLYKIKTAYNGTTDFDLKMSDGVLLDVSECNGAYAIANSGSVTKLTKTWGALTAGFHKVTFNDVAGLKVGDWLCFYDPTEFSYSQWRANYNDGSTSPAVLQSFLLLFCWFTLVLVGYFFIQNNKEISLKILLIFSGLFFLYAIIYMITEGKFMLNFGAPENSDLGKVSGYQSIARSFLLISFFCIAFLKNRTFSIFATIGFAILLFAIGARSEFYAFLAAILAYHFLLSLKLKTSMIAIIIILVSSVGLGTYFFDQISESRHFQIVNLDESSSWNARKQFEEKAIRDIKNNPILGNFGGHVRDGSVGESAHNIYSAYSNYGLIFFILFLLINLYIFIKSTVKLIQLPNNKEWNFLFLLSFSVVLLLFTSKSVFWEVPFLLWGAFLGVRYTEKTQLVLNKTT